MAACWLLAALLRWMGSWSPPAGEPSCRALDCLAPAYAMCRGAAVAAVRRSSALAAVQTLLRPVCALLRDAATAASAEAPFDSGSQLVQAAAAVMALGGLAEGLLRAAAGFPEAAQLAMEAESSLVAACTAAAAALAAAPTAVTTADKGQAGQALLVDACALASAQLCAAVQRPELAAAAARCQAQALLHSALSLVSLRQAATAMLPPGQASVLLQHQAGCALVQQAAAMASSLAALYPQLPGGDQRWLVQQVQVAARQAHVIYRQLALSASPAWLAAVDAASVRQLLDKLFLACLALLGAAWQAAAAQVPAQATQLGHGSAAAAPPAAGQRDEAERAQLAATVVGVLADLQFCRVGTAQYAALLRAALAEAPSDPAAADSLAACLPCYADLAVQCPAHGGQAAWLVDAVSAAKVQLLFNALVPCCAMLAVVSCRVTWQVRFAALACPRCGPVSYPWACDETVPAHSQARLWSSVWLKRSTRLLVVPQTALEERLAPLVFLYLLHPHRPAAAAAHQLFCALLVALPEERREPLAAFYVHRSLEGCSDGAPTPPELGQGLATVLASLPLGSPVPLLCLRQLLDACETLAARWVASWGGAGCGMGQARGARRHACMRTCRTPCTAPRWGPGLQRAVVGSC